MTQADATPVRIPSPAPLRMEQLHRQWEGLRTPGANHDLWIFGYGSLIWRPEFDYAEHHPVRIHGWHRALKMWSHLYRGTPACPGLVFALLPGGSCRGVVFRVPRRDAPEVLRRVWEREMVTNIYTPRWLRCATPGGEQHALTFTLSRRSPSYAGTLSEARYREIFGNACGCYGSTLDYARQTHEALCRHGIRDRALHRLLALAGH
jgi:cation transport protein ChaC